MKADERKCPRCAEPIKIEAKACKHCGYELTPDEISAGKAQARKQLLQGGVGCLVLVVLLALALTMCSGEDLANDTTPAADPAAAKTEFIGLSRSVLDEAKRCDDASSAASEAVARVSKGSGSNVEAYSAATRAEQMCQEAWLAIGRVEPPPSAAAADRHAIKQTIETCQMAYYERKEGLGTLKKALDGDLRPSVLAEYQDQRKAADGGVLACIAGLMDGGMKLGVAPDHLTSKLDAK